MFCWVENVYSCWRGLICQILANIVWNVNGSKKWEVANMQEHVDLLT